MKNQDIAKSHFILNIVNRCIETYLDGYCAVIDPYDFLKSSYNELDLRYFNSLPNSHDFLKTIADLREQRRLNRRNAYAALGTTIFQLDLKELAFFTELMICRANLDKSSEPLGDEFLFFREPEHFISELGLEDSKAEYLIPGSAGHFSDEEVDFISSIYPDLTETILEIDIRINHTFQKSVTSKLASIHIDKDDQIEIDDIEAIYLKKN